MGGGRRGTQQFMENYHCNSTAVAGRDLDEGDKIILPPSALDKLARMNVEYPMLFEIMNPNVEKRTHCGVLEFSAEEGFCYLPLWMMENLFVSKILGIILIYRFLSYFPSPLQLEEGQFITVKNVSLPKATFVKFQAQSCDFLEVANPRALLEVALRKYTCLTEGDMICIPHKNIKFYLEVRDVQPNGAASIIETDCNVDFDEPVGYKDSKYEKKEQKESGSNGSGTGGSAITRPLQKAKADTTDESEANKFKPFAGAPKRIDGKLPPSVQQAKLSVGESKGESKSSEPAADSKAPPVVPSYQSKIGDKFSKKKSAVSAFGGAGYKLSG